MICRGEQSVKVTECQNCKSEFTITSQDTAFYKKLEVPAPTFCSDCRLQRRLAWRNERTLYSRACDLCEKNIIGMYAPGAPPPVYCQECWWSDKWNPLVYGQEYDFSRPFFEQFGELVQKVPRFPFFRKQCVNSDYVNVAAQTKDSYLVFASIKYEDGAYGKLVWECRDVFDALYCYKCERCYQIIDCSNCYGVTFSNNCVNCQDSSFLVDCANCKNCFGCVGLRNKQYYFNNQPYTKEEYEKKIASLPSGPFKIKDNYPRRFASLINCQNSTGDHLTDSTRCISCFDLKHSEDCKYVFTGNNIKDSYDCTYLGLPAELIYESVTSYRYNTKFSVNNFDNLNISYCTDCYNAENLFACIGLSKFQYCIFNKKYSKEDYGALKEKIIAHMSAMPYKDTKGRIYAYGEFFPIEISPFAYNETVAQEYFVLTQKQANAQGYRWKNTEVRTTAITLEPENFPRAIAEASDDLLRETIGCEHAAQCNEQCTKAFRLIPQELAFYKQMNLPLPRRCPNCRHYQRLKFRNSMKLWQRTCTCAGVISDNGVYKNTLAHFHNNEHCPNKFETSYAPERKEIVYCEQCYLSELA